MSFNRVDFTDAIPYVLCQIGGGSIAAYIIKLQLSPEINNKLE